MEITETTERSRKMYGCHGAVTEEVRDHGIHGSHRAFTEDVRNHGIHGAFTEVTEHVQGITEFMELSRKSRNMYVDRFYPKLGMV